MKYFVTVTTEDGEVVERSEGPVGIGDLFDEAQSIGRAAVFIAMARANRDPVADVEREEREA